MATDNAAAAAAPLSMKLLIDTSAQRLLFAEASKDVVDFLFSLLALPVGTAVSLLGEDSMVGSVGNLYASVQDLDDTYLQPSAAKDALLRPVVLSPAVSASSSSLLRLLPPSSGESKGEFFKCSHCNDYVTDTSGTPCPSHRAGNSIFGAQNYGMMTTAMQFVSGDQDVKAAAAGGAKGFVTYTVMDNLKVTPMSSISSITLLNTFAVKDLATLQEKTVQLGYSEGLAILKASLQSKTVLTDVFLAGKKLAGEDGSA